MIYDVFDSKVFKSYIEARLSPFKKNCVTCLIENPLKVMKNVFYFVIKALCVLKIFKVFVTTFWSSGKNSLIRKIKLTSKLMTLQPVSQTTAIHILLNI